MLPRPVLIQGVLSGVVFAVGYGVGNAVLWIWRFLSLPTAAAALRQNATRVLTILALILVVVTLTRAAVWQNSIRDLMGMRSVQTTDPILVVAIAWPVGLTFILLAKGLIWLGTKVISWTTRVLPPRPAMLLGTVLFVLTVLTFVDGFIVKKAISGMDETFALLDGTVDAGAQPPTISTSSGSAASLITWDSIGRTGKNFIAEGSTAAEIAKFTGKAAKDPIRIYAGFNTADTIEERAEIALADLIRAGGFDRGTLVVATPTGTGWMDPAAMEPLAFVTGGDVAIVAAQYSYLPSWLTLITDPDRSRHAAKVLFDKVYGHWSTLPEATRPRLYLFGLSLGALGSEAAVDLISLFDDPIHGALWAGPPFASRIWPQVVEGRAAGSPAWRPIFRDGSLIRFMTQSGLAETPEMAWGKMRLIYLQHPSDPMSFFLPDLAFNRPEWLVDRGPEISPYFQWFPLVTFFQVMFDVPLATSVPPGFAHTFKAESYIDGWINVLEPKGWQPQDTQRLKDRFADFNASPI